MRWGRQGLGQRDDADPIMTMISRAIDAKPCGGKAILSRSHSAGTHLMRKAKATLKAICRTIQANQANSHPLASLLMIGPASSVWGAVAPAGREG
jgi:hypothetical protein